jgi:hypothetical protein
MRSAGAFRRRFDIAEIVVAALFSYFVGITLIIHVAAFTGGNYLWNDNATVCSEQGTDHRVPCYEAWEKY